MEFNTLKGFASILTIASAATLIEAAIASGRGHTDAYSGPYLTENFVRFDTYVDDLGKILYHFNDTICSATIAGMWIFYENVNYNTLGQGQVYWSHGSNYHAEFGQFCDKTSSLKFAGNRRRFNQDSVTVYEWVAFAGQERYISEDTADLGYLDKKTRSLVITGQGNWTFFTQTSFGGQGYCFHPSQYPDSGPAVPDLYFGVYPSIDDVDVPEDSFRSCRRGCSQGSTDVYPKPSVQQSYEQTSSNRGSTVKSERT